MSVNVPPESTPTRHMPVRILSSRASPAPLLPTALDAVNLGGRMPAAELAVAFFLQMAVILAACRLVGAAPAATQPVA